MRTLALLLAAALAVRAEWSFKDFFEGEWALERTRAGAVTRAFYSLNATADGALEGLYHEEGANEEPTNQMRVRLLFDDELGRVGKFQLAKLKQADKWEGGADEELEPVPAAQQPEPRTVFSFAFAPQMDERFWISESRWMGASGGKVQFVVAVDSFMISQVCARVARRACSTITRARACAALADGCARRRRRSSRPSRPRRARRPRRRRSPCPPGLRSARARRRPRAAARARRRRRGGVCCRGGGPTWARRSRIWCTRSLSRASRQAACRSASCGRPALPGRVARAAALQRCAERARVTRAPRVGRSLLWYVLWASWTQQDTAHWSVQSSVWVYHRSI
eukprot:3548918-Prymnesium_polylepis.1